MADSTDSAAAGTAVRAQRATAAAAMDQAYRAFLDHAQDCTACRTSGTDCEPAAELKQIWRDAKTAAA